MVDTGGGELGRKTAPVRLAPLRAGSCAARLWGARGEAAFGTSRFQGRKA